MKALIVVEGFGTELRPLTLSFPKPLIEFANKPIILHQLEALNVIGVTEVVIALNYQPPKFMLNFLKDFEIKLGIKITVSLETEQLATALVLFRNELLDDSGEPFFVLNSDVISDYPLKEMIEFHQGHKGEASILVTKVEVTSKYGGIVMEENTCKVDKFVVEPPKLFDAGIYLLNPSVLDRIKLNPFIIEEEVFSKIVAFTMVSTGFCTNIGQPRDYISSMRLYLDWLRKKSSIKLATGTKIVGNVIIDETAKIAKGCIIGPDVVIGPDCIIEQNVRLISCTLMREVKVKKNAGVFNSIVGWRSTIGAWARLDNMTILGENVHVFDTILCNGGVSLPNTVFRSDFKPEIFGYPIPLWWTTELNEDSNMIDRKLANQNEDSNMVDRKPTNRKPTNQNEDSNMVDRKPTNRKPANQNKDSNMVDRKYANKNEDSNIKDSNMVDRKYANKNEDSNMVDRKRANKNEDSNMVDRNVRTRMKIPIWSTETDKQE